MITITHTSNSGFYVQDVDDDGSEELNADYAFEDFDGLVSFLATEYGYEVRKLNYITVEDDTDE